MQGGWVSGSFELKWIWRGEVLQKGAGRVPSSFEAKNIEKVCVV